MERSSENDNRHLRPRDIAAAIVLSLMLTAAAYLSRTNPAAPEDRLPGRDVAVHAAKRGFTLIEMSIVLVIIGLIVGGVLVGQDLIRAAGVRATISQIEKYNTAANTFRGKYGYLPGDIRDPDASSFGFQARGSQPGQGDGNGTIEGNNCAAAVNGEEQAGGETVMFWVDLSTAGLINDTLNSYVGWGCSASLTTSYYPQAKMGNYFVFAMGFSGTNYFHFGATYSGYGGGPGIPANALTAMTPVQAYAFDSKVDDGLPQSGRVLAQYINVGNYPIGWARGGGVTGALPGAAAGRGASGCYDNNNTAGVTAQYSVEVNANSNNCALLVQFQ